MNGISSDRGKCLVFLTPKSLEIQLKNKIIIQEKPLGVGFNAPPFGFLSGRKTGITMERVFEVGGKCGTRTGVLPVSDWPQPV